MGRVQNKDTGVRRSLNVTPFRQLDAGECSSPNYFYNPTFCSWLNIGIRHKDAFIVFPCLLWSITCLINFSYTLASSVISYKFPATLPLLWAIISCLFSSCAALLIVTYHVSEVEERGLSMETVKYLKLFIFVTSFVGLTLLFSLCILGTVFLIQCSYRKCIVGNYIVNISWMLATIGWLIAVLFLIPRRNYLEKLVDVYERHAAMRRFQVFISTDGYPSNAEYIYDRNVYESTSSSSQYMNDRCINNTSANPDTYITSHPSPNIFGNPSKNNILAG